MDARAFFDKVSQMRRYQREYFKARRERKSKSVCDRWLDLSCKAEQEIDSEIERVNALLGIKEKQIIQGQLDFNK